MVTHDDLLVLSCDVCERKFGELKLMMLHKRAHANEGRYTGEHTFAAVMTTCSKRFGPAASVERVRREPARAISLG